MEHWTQICRDALGETAYEEAFAHGETLSAEEAIACAQEVQKYLILPMAAAAVSPTAITNQIRE